jgi:hypothetical protein
MTSPASRQGRSSGSERSGRRVSADDLIQWIKSSDERAELERGASQLGSAVALSWPAIPVPCAIPPRPGQIRRCCAHPLNPPPNADIRDRLVARHVSLCRACSRRKLAFSRLERTGMHKRCQRPWHLAQWNLGSIWGAEWLRHPKARIPTQWRLLLASIRLLSHWRWGEPAERKRILSSKGRAASSICKPSICMSSGRWCYRACAWAVSATAQRRRYR